MECLDPRLKGIGTEELLDWLDRHCRKEDLLPLQPLRIVRSC